jgi:hypothetical protein
VVVLVVVVMAVVVLVVMVVGVLVVLRGGRHAPDGTPSRAARHLRSR